MWHFRLRLQRNGKLGKLFEIAAIAVRGIVSRLRFLGTIVDDPLTFGPRFQIADVPLLSAIRQFDGPVFTAFDGQARGTSVPSWPDFPIPVPARCRDGGKRNWEFGARAPVSW